MSERGRICGKATKLSKDGCNDYENYKHPRRYQILSKITNVNLYKVMNKKRNVHHQITHVALHNVINYGRKQVEGGWRYGERKNVW